jgi:hypothetical protein
MTRLPNTITFLCPNGHRLSCPEQQAGKGGKCPKCGASFKIPLPHETPSNPAPPVGTVGDTQPYDFSGLNGPGNGAPPAEQEAPAGESAGDESAAGEPAPAAPPDPDKIEFLCPNGHRLFGPKTLVGRAGQCPHCGARFIVPDPDEHLQQQTEAPPPEPENLEINLDSGSKVDKRGSSPKVGSKVGKDSKVGRDSALKIGPPEEEPPEEIEEEAADEEYSETSDEPEEFTPPAGESSSVLAEFFESVWSYKQDGATVEIHLADGKMFMPDYYAPQLSQRSHGVFAVREPNRTNTLTIVAWTSISRVVVRGLPELPPDMV